MQYTPAEALVDTLHGKICFFALAALLLIGLHILYHT